VGGPVTWSSTIRLSDLARGVVSLSLEPPEATLADWAKTLGLLSMPQLEARITVRSWLDGAELTGRFHGRVEQVCGVSLDPFIQPVDGEVELRVVPQGSPNTPIETLAGEVDLDPEAPDPRMFWQGTRLILPMSCLSTWPWRLIRFLGNLTPFSITPPRRLTFRRFPF